MSEDTTKKTVGRSEVVGRKKDTFLTKEEAISQALEMLESARHFLVGTNAEDGFPNIKTMSNRGRHEGLKTIWFHTDASSHRVQQLKRDNRACVYCLDTKLSRGVMLVGTMEILHDLDSKRMIWQEGERKYYPMGVEDPEYSVLRFTAIRAGVVDAMANKGLTFEIE
ncbi:MAG: pyridoxamine 5'-phosphate oxidase family protein [Chloroflexi bacterium]|nr:pyridoxamine 5'-phosphate oxidase family protein [Chloroflexota bacterium]